MLAEVSYSLCYIKCTYNNVSLKVVIDSGAQISVMASSLLPILGLEYKIDKNYRGTAMGVGTSNILGKIFEVDFECGNYTLTSNFSVMEMKENMILLGLDFLVNNECVIDIKNKELLIGDHTKIKFLNEGEIDELRIPVVNKINTPMIQKIINNILNNPKEDKFKKINRKMLKGEEEQYLLRLGFVEANEKLIFNDNIALLNDAIMCM